MNELKGTGVALVTPFDQNLDVDYEGILNLIHHVQKHVDYLTVMGTTGENPTIRYQDQLSILDFILAHTQLPVVFGMGGNDTMAYQERLASLKSRKISAILVTSPYYNKPSQQGIIEHYKKIAQWTKFPVILYNVPARTASNITAETTLALARLEGIVAIKEASGYMEQCDKIVSNMPGNFDLISGDDQHTHKLLTMGASGVISVLANCLPKEISELVDKGRKGLLNEAISVNERLTTCYDLMFREGNPTSVKTALEMIGICDRRVRLPLMSGSAELASALKIELREIKKG